ncbi:MAG: hypothetical protein KIT35_21990 [Piscinibacter sp.]|uniref:hypothetical protein n=1 Tax=Piscinibacter sp. TaxID=1903157 RepID=UPI002585F6F1|nr:hypothetical protein [Piscinibacter sp.]MCW5666512.1 hypothetical protein [Piscinibacter sp.]
MTIQFELWHLISLGAMIISAFYGMARMLMAQASKAIDEKFNRIAETLKAQDENARRLERELLDLKAELPRNYVRREDYVQAIASIMTKLDGLSLNVENKFLQLYQERNRPSGAAA